jgi:hypothetical protein
MNRTELTLQSSGRKPAISAVLILGVFLLGGVGVLIGVVRQPPANPNVIAITLLFVAIMCLVPIPLIRVASRARAYIEGDELVMVTGVARKRLALANLRARGIDIVDLQQRRDLYPRLRFWGASMPGLNAGWFRLRNGEKAFCIITEQNRVSYLRSTKDNVSLLLSLENPDELKALIECR